MSDRQPEAVVDARTAAETADRDAEQVTESETDTEPVLRVAGLRKEFGDTLAVDDVSLDVSRGSFFALLGPSGCGKTTTLRCIAGLESPDAGRIDLAGTDVTRTPANRRDTHLVFQDLVLFPHMTVAENVAYGLARRGVPETEREERVADLLELIGLPDAGDRDPESLSGGQRQRVALARALAPEPSLVLLDEPLSSLDRKLREEMRSELQRIQREVGTTFLYVTHDQESAMTMADHVAVMRDGRLVETGDPERLYAAPDTEFVARFFGDATVFRGVVDAEAGVVRTDAGLAVPVADSELEDGDDDASDDDHAPADGERVTVVVRPESVVVGTGAGSRDGATDGLDGGVEATVVSAAYHGTHYEYDLELADGTALRAHDRDRPADPDETVTVRVESGTVVEPDTEREARGD
jgi:spermidine/putrescine transport system ATP-binding protein